MLSEIPTTFNGVMLEETDEGTVKMNQPSKIDKLRKAEQQTELKSQPALAQCIGIYKRPDICAKIQLIEPEVEPSTKEEYKTL